jgi:lipopolysaccharide/colanic/teichoic acid biosynthesis glycosyltransferase
MMRAPATCFRQQWERLFDVSCAAAGLLLLTPVFAGVALAILIGDGPPVLFRQTRVGKEGKPFRILKFRTMRACSHGNVITVAGDNRVTNVGAVLRKYKLDELPQLVNVLVGDMSLVGPRPEVPEHVQFEAPIWREVLHVRPGITDLASLLYRDEERILSASEDPYSFYRESVLPAKLLLNLTYLQSRSLWQDLKLILLTVRYSLFHGELDAAVIMKLVASNVEKR